MEMLLTFVAQGKQKKYPGKSTIIDALDKSQEVKLTFIAEDDQIVIINHYGELSGCIPSGNPATLDEYACLRHHLNIASPITAIAIPHNLFTYCVQVTV